MKNQLLLQYPLIMLYLGNAENIGKLLNRRHYYFVPVKQNNPITKPRSLVFIPEFIKKTLEMALDNEQVQPMLFF